ncbi:hypothetical protein ABH935_007174 [Catenulispora sp. GAS73]|uniref:hypothetical protein n=1 Tax=Catenulispora sp. GAS73 TaxID=3156269 RepID=UPI0035177B4E
MHSEQPRRRSGSRRSRRAAPANSETRQQEAVVAERGGNWIVETGEVSAQDTRFTNSLAESQALQERLREGGGVGAVATMFATMSEADVQSLAENIARPYDEILDAIRSHDEGADEPQGE